MNRTFPFIRTRPRPTTAATLVCCLALPAGKAFAQPCDQLFPPPPGSPNERVHSVIEYDGELIIGGRFTQIGGIPLNRLARWNNGTWEEFGDGTNGEVERLTIHNGDLIVSGYFSSIGGISTSNVARWDGEQWHPFPAAPAPHVIASTVSAGGTLYGYARGNNWLYEWEGTAWELIGTIPFATNNILHAVAFKGDLHIAGNFSQVNGMPAVGVARWDGENWHPLGAGITTGTGVRSLSVYNGELHAGGLLIDSGGVPVSDVVRWDGTLWQSVGADPFLGFVNAMGVYAGQLIAAGGDPNLGATGGRVARWNGVTWDQLGHDFTGLVAELTQSGDTLVVVGHLPGNDVLFWRDCAAACCVNGACLLLTEEQCAAVGGTYLGVGVSCDDVACEPVEPTCPHDLNNDGTVDILDLLLLLSAWGPCR